MAANTQRSISFYLFHFHLLLLLLPMAAPQSNLCRTSCGSIPIRYPFGIDDGSGSPYYYRHLFLCANSVALLLRTPSDRYPVRSISYADPQLVLSDPSMWSCSDDARFCPAKPSLSTPASASPSPPITTNSSSTATPAASSPSPRPASATASRTDAEPLATPRATSAATCRTARQR